MKLERAYSIIEVKAVDDEKREVTGIATTPTTDRMGDIVEPKGAEFKLPIPLLSQHDPTKPIGHVTKAKVTKSGIEITAKLVKPYEGAPQAWADRLDSAWADIKSGLVRGLSIGFQPIETARIEDSYGVRFIKWLWLELSSVTIPANGDASILSIKSIDTQLRAASGHTQKVIRIDSTTAGASAKQHTPKEGKSMNLADQIKSFEAKRMASAEALEALMSKATEEGRTLDESEAEKYKDLKSEIESVDEHLERLRDLESLQASKAAVVKAKSVDEGARSRDIAQRHITVESTLPKGIEFARYVRCLAAAKGNTMGALEIAKSRYPDNPRIHTVLKAAVAAGTTTDATWAGPFVEYQTLASEFIEFLRPQTILGKFGTGGIPALRQVPFNVRMLAQTSGGAGYWVGQGAPKPLTAFDFEAVTLGFSKVANIAVITEELARFSNPSADAIVRQSLADALRARLDIDFIDPDKALVSGVSPASITNGITPISSSGATAADVRADVEAVMAAFIAANLAPSSGVWIMSSGTALALSMMRDELGQTSFPGISMLGGTFVGLPVITSEYVPSDTSGSMLILVNANDIFLADDGNVVIDASREASLQMDNAPTNNSATATGASLVSMYQTNSIALKAERFINWARRRDEAVQYVTGVAYSSAAAS